MDKRIKQKWIDALLSGEYQQTRQQLFDGDGYCCLGVLCDLYRKEHKEHEWSHTFSEFEQKDKWEFLDQSETLPNDVIFWSGLPNCDPQIKEIKSPDGRVETLAFANDSGYRFDEIAKMIDNNY
jgi:hypothetical protein